MTENDAGLAKLTWTNPQTDEREEFILGEGATASIGRLTENQICIPDMRISRRHAVVRYDPDIGGFMVQDTGSSNGTSVNDKQIGKPHLLQHGDIIGLYKSVTVTFSSMVTEHDRTLAAERGTLITASINTGKGKLIITTGPQEGNTIPLLLNELTVGRATSRATWEIALQDPSVSRPHAKIELNGSVWHIRDLGSSNGTMVNGEAVTDNSQPLNDGDLIAFGSTLALFRLG